MSDAMADPVPPPIVGGGGYVDDMPATHTRIDSLKEDLQVIGDMVLDLRAKVVAHDRRFDQIDARLAAHDARFDIIDAQLAEILARLPQLPSSAGTAN